MARSVICIARTLGAGGEEVGQLIAAKLGYRYVDNEIIERAAERAGVSAESVAKAERPPGLLSRILDGIAAGSGAGESMAVLAGANMYVPADWTPHAQLSYEELIQQVIVEVANQGKAVILAHGASICLRERKDAIRVLVTASNEKRVERVQTDGVTAQAAERSIRASDRARREYLWRFYNVRNELPTHYDLTVSTDALSSAEAANIVMSALG
jgi:cytidylate kinase